MRRTVSALGFVAPFLLAGCMVAPVMPPSGMIYTGTTAPLDLDLNNTDLGTKHGRADASSILGLFAWGNAGVSAAAQAGGITKIKHADYEQMNVLGIYQRYTTIVYGD